MVRDRKNDRCQKQGRQNAEKVLNQLRKAVKKEFGDDMGIALGHPNITKKERDELIHNNDEIMKLINELNEKLVENRHFKEKVESKANN